LLRPSGYSFRSYHLTTPSFIEDEAHICYHLDQTVGAMRSIDTNENAPSVDPNKTRLNYFQKSELKVFASCVYFDVQFIHLPVGINFETKEATRLLLETMRNRYKSKHIANMKKEAEEKKLAKQKAKQESKQRTKEKVEEEKCAKEMARKTPYKAPMQSQKKIGRPINFSIKAPC
jgi:hypothetical protein